MSQQHAYFSVAVMAGFAVVVSFWIHRFPPEELVDVAPRSVPVLSERNVGSLSLTDRPLGRSAS